MFESHENVNVSAAILCPAVQARKCSKSIKFVTDEQIFFCSSLVKSKLKKMAAPSAQLGSKKVLFCINSDRTTNRNMHTKIFAYFQANLHVLFWFPIKEQQKLVHFSGVIVSLCAEDCFQTGQEQSLETRISYEHPEVRETRE